MTAEGGSRSGGGVADRGKRGGGSDGVSETPWRCFGSSHFRLPSIQGRGNDFYI